MCREIDAVNAWSYRLIKRSVQQSLAIRGASAGNPPVMQPGS